MKIRSTTLLGSGALNPNASSANEHANSFFRPARFLFRLRLISFEERLALWSVASFLGVMLLRLAVKDMRCLAPLRKPAPDRYRHSSVLGAVSRWLWVARTWGKLFTLAPPAKLWEQQLTRDRMLTIYTRLKSIHPDRKIITSSRIRDLQVHRLHVMLANALKISRERQACLAETLRHEVLLAAIHEIAHAAEHPALNSSQSLERALIQVTRNHRHLANTQPLEMTNTPISQLNPQ